MNKPTIGIRQADGSFYGIMEDEGTPRKRLVLSAAKSGQHSVRIDLYRSSDGLMEDASLVGSLDLMSEESLEFQDISFDVSIDEDAQLSATATLPSGESSSVDFDLSEFRESKRSDADILADDSYGGDELDTLDDAFSLDDDEVQLPSDGDEIGLDLPDVDPAPKNDDSSFSMDDLDAGFGMDDLDEAEPALAESLDDAEPEAPTEAAGAADDDSWHDFSMDDMEPMEFLDTGDQISAPKSSLPPKSAAASEFSMDDDAPLDLAADEDGSLEDFDEDLGSGLPDFGSELPEASTEDSGLDDDFLPPPELSDDKAFASAQKAEKKAKSQEKRTEKPVKAKKPSESGTGPIDKTALVLSLVLLSLLVVSLMVLLFLNMIRPPQAPVIQPEVLQYRPTSGLAASAPGSPERPSEIDLASPDAPSFSASTVLEVPAALRSARISMTLSPGDTLADVSRRLGNPDHVEGDQLFW